MNQFAFLLRRELWEHRALVIVPLVFMAVVVLAITFGLLRGTEYVGLSDIVYELQSLAPGKATAALGTGAFTLWSVFWLVSYFVIAFYLLDALYADRKDRSILFWKSLPISDTQTVLSKLVTAIVVAPAIATVAALVTMLLLLIVGSLAILVGGGNPFTLLWLEFPWLSAPLKIVGVTLAHSVWFLPFTGWLLFASATAKKTPFLMAALVPLGIIFAERLAFDTSVLARLVGSYLERFGENIFSASGEFGVHIHDDQIDVTGSIADLGSVFATFADPVLWLGIAIGVAFIFGAIQMRQRRVDAG